MVMVWFSFSILVNTSVNVSRRVSAVVVSCRGSTWSMPFALACWFAHSSIDKKTAATDSVALVLIFVVISIRFFDCKGIAV